MQDLAIGIVNDNDAYYDDDKLRWAKVLAFCELAKSKGYDDCWIDTCCTIQTRS
jgi:hypothetical protein